MGKKRKPQTYRHTSPLRLGRYGPGFLRVRGRGGYGPDKGARPHPRTLCWHFSFIPQQPCLGAPGGNFLPAWGGAGPVLSSRPRRVLQRTLGTPLKTPGSPRRSDRVLGPGCQGAAGWPRAPAGRAGVGQRLPAETRVGARHLLSCRRRRCAPWRRRIHSDPLGEFRAWVVLRSARISFCNLFFIFLRGP